MKPRSGRVILIGAGPGDPELITLKAARLLGEADVVLVDDLVDRRVLAHARPGARIIEVGKRGGCRVNNRASTPQAFIEKLMVRLARRGATVARLKGGDPFVFGRGGEEIEALAAAGIPHEVVSGITAGIAVPAAPDWAALRAGGTTIVVYMGVRRVSRIVADMLGAGFPANTPACAVQSGSLAEQAQVVTTLAALPAAVAAAAIGSPAILVIGAVVALAQAQALPAVEYAA